MIPFAFLGALAGGFTGFAIGGGFLVGGFSVALKAALIGLSLGYAVGSLFDLTKADTGFGSPAGKLQIPSNEIGKLIPDALGTVKVVGGQLLCYGKEKAVPQYEKVKVGLFKKKKVLVGYKYYASWVLGICFGPVDTLYTIFDEEDPIWEGTLDRPESGFPEEIVIDGRGNAQFFFGTDTQNKNDDVGLLLDDSTLNTGWRGLCWIYFHNNYIGDYNRLPTFSFVVRKAPSFSFSAKHEIQVMDYNPMHAEYYILSFLAGLPETWLHTSDFTSVALTLYIENRGISILFDSSGSAELYLESVHRHIDGLLRYGTDGKFHPKLIRDDYDEGTLSSVDESMGLEEPEFNRGSWIDTINEVKVEYSEIPRSLPSPPLEYLIGWYRVDEGSGTILYNSAPQGVANRLPNLDVYGGGEFWTVFPGFGTGSSTHFAYKTDTARTIYYDNTKMCFFRIGGPGVIYNWLYASDYSYQGSAWQCIRHSNYGAGQYVNQHHGNNSEIYGTLSQVQYNGILSKWCFTFNYYDASDNEMKVGVVLDDGTLTIGTVTRAGVYATPSGPHNHFFAFRGWDSANERWGWFQGQIGDIIIYNSSGGAGSGVLSLSQCAECYDSLRSRYGMAARSGW